MRTCGECSLCCKLARVEEVEKPSWTWCKHCDIGHGCRIYHSPDRPRVCQDFKCRWLTDFQLPDEWRPDLVHLFVTGNDSDDFIRIVAEDISYGFPVIEYFRKRGQHVLIAGMNSLIFVQGEGREKPAKIVADWIL